MGVRSNFNLIFKYFALNIKKEWQYKSAFFMQIFGMIINDIFLIIQFVIMYSVVDNIAGYGLNETLYLLALSAGSFGASHMFFNGAWKIPKMIYNGAIDVYLTQPKNLLINIACSSTDVSAIGDFLYGFIILFIIRAPWWAFLAYIPLTICSGIIFASVVTTYSCLSFYIKNGDALADATQSVMTIVDHYPMPIFRTVVKYILLTVIPAFFIVGIPVNYVFVNFNPWWILIYLGVMVLWVIVAFLTFKLGLKKYSSGNLMGGRI